jgi:hypothetical protein
MKGESAGLVFDAFAAAHSKRARPFSGGLLSVAHFFNILRRVRSLDLSIPSPPT